MSFLGELKRRNVIRVAVAYLVFAWLVMQILDVLSPVLDLPQAGLRMVLVMLALGFVGALVFSWAYELTPDGLKRESEVDRAQSVTHITAKKLDIAVIALLVLAIGLFVFDRVSPERASAKPSTAPPVPAVAATVATKESAPEATPMASAPRGSVAVLSFTNMSPDPDNEYFADGIAEELLNVLAQVEGLKVASRTSAFSFKGKQASVREIAHSLNVTHVLEGSVRKQDKRVRITAQLIDAATDQHLWSHTYDRELTDIFAVQEEIAQAISSALSGALGLAGQSPKVQVSAPTKDLQAYELYLRGRQLFHQRGGALPTARKLLEEAVARDSAFAEAWAILGGIHRLSPNYLGVTPAQAYAAASDAAERARALDDGLALPYAVLAEVARERGDLLEGERLFGAAIRRDPRDSTTRLWRGLHYVRVGELAKAEDDLRRAVEIDPLAGITVGWLATVRGLRGDREAAERGLQRAAELGWPTDWLHWRFALANQDRQRAISDLRSSYARTPNLPPSTRTVIDAIYAVIDDPSKSAALVAAVRADPAGINDQDWGGMLALLGMHREAVVIETKRTTQHAQRTLYHKMWYPTARGVLSEPGFLELAERDGLLAYWNAKGFPEGCRLVDTPVRHLDCK